MIEDCITLPTCSIQNTPATSQSNDLESLSPSPRTIRSQHPWCRSRIHLIKVPQRIQTIRAPHNQPRIAKHRAPQPRIRRNKQRSRRIPRHQYRRARISRLNSIVTPTLRRGLRRETRSCGYIHQLLAVPIARAALPSSTGARLVRRRRSECAAGWGDADEGAPVQTVAAHVCAGAVDHAVPAYDLLP
jgi:hypothetical protein